MRLARSVFLISVLVLFAVPVMAVEFMPLAVGNRWSYDAVKLTRANITYQGRNLAVMKNTASGTAVYEVTDVDSGNPAVYNYVESSEFMVNGGDADSSRTDLKVRWDADGLKILGTLDTSNGEEPDSQTYDPPLLYFSKDAWSGGGWDVGEMRDQNTVTTMTGKSVGRETVTVPAGTFKDCLKVVYSSDNVSGTVDIWEKEFTITSGKSRGVYWIAEGIGVVKEVETYISSAEAPGPAGGMITVSGATCVINELKPGYVVKK